MPETNKSLTPRPKKEYGSQRAIADRASAKHGQRSADADAHTPTPMRRQLAEIREGTSYNNANDTGYERGAIINQYSNQAGCWGAAVCNSTDNNGNLKAQDIYIASSDSTTWRDSFSYDSLNRLTMAQELPNGVAPSSWQQAYIYDRWGNRRIDPTQTSGGVNSLSFSVDPNTNRLGVPSGQTGTMGYDFAGNLTTDTYSGGGGRTYDAENRMVTAYTGSEFNQYTYDGDGRRVRRNIGGVETWQVYGFGGELVAEYAPNAAPTSPQKEYGYRNGQLLITATVTAGWGAAPTLHDNPLQVQVTYVQALHITELRNAINSLRSHLGMSAYSWQYSATTNDYISANPVVEMRTALDQALGAPSGGYSAGLAQGQAVKAIHIQELRDRVLGAWITSSSTDVRWLVTDQLGTPRMIFDSTGNLATMTRHDYLPFGEELFAGQGLRTTAQGYPVQGLPAIDGARQQFTLKERDNETGLDYFLARYYASTQGRFTSPDEFTGGPEEIGVLGSGHPEEQALKYAEVTNPQSLNKYQYCFNNPLRFIDPDGQNPQTGGDLNFERDERDFLSHKISEQQFRSRMNARGVGAAVGAAIVVGVLYGPEAATAILMWASRNPDKVGQIALDLNQASTGSPAPGSPGLSIATETRLTATEVSTGVRLAAQTGTRLAESPFVGEEFVSTAGKTYDAMGGGKAFQNFGNGSKFFDSIVHHVNKSVDYVAIDLKGASGKQINAIQKFVSGLTKKQQEKIIYVK